MGSWKVSILDGLVKSRIPPPTARGDEGEGDRNLLKLFDFHPHPHPLPSKERGFFDFLRDHQV
jgi:hypothetical protein